MVLKSYLIAPEGGGLQRDLEPWLIPEDAFSFLEDAYVWRGRIRKRFGYSLIGSNANNSRLRINLGNTDGSGNISVTVPGSIFKVGQTFSIGTEIFTVNATGTPAAMLTTGAATTATYNTTSGALVVNGAALATACWFYPAEPVMGLRLRENTAFNFEATVGFDTQFAYERSAGAWQRLGTALWTGSNSQFYWTTNYRGANPYETLLYVTNFKVQGGGGEDGIKHLPQGSSTWTNLRPQLDAGGAPTRFLETCKVLLGFKDRLVALNTIEDESATDRAYVNRARWSQNGDPTAAATAWLDDTPGRGGYLDAPTKEAIITAELLKDRLIVYFERSTWELVYTADTQLPFRWQQINSELGAESTFSIIGFDQVALGVGNVGIHACDGVSVRRIDQKIPDEVFKIHNGNSGVERVYGIRDYYRQLAYWTFPDLENDPIYPTKVLVFDYDKGTWAYINDSFTCFGYNQYDADLAWSDLGSVYGTWANWNDPWGSAQTQSQFPWIVAGNQEGWVLKLDTDKSSNSQSLSITDMASNQLTVIDHNLTEGEYVLVEGAQGITSLNGNIYIVDSVPDANTIVLDTTFTGTYLGDGKLTRVSGIRITSKQWNPGTPVGQQFRIPYIDLLLDRTDAGEVSLRYFGDFDQSSSINDESDVGVLLGSETVTTAPDNSLGEAASGARLWHRYFMSAQSTTLQIEIYLSDAQIRNHLIATSDIQLNATMIYVEPSGRITG